jgi:hypothetical protein
MLSGGKRGPLLAGVILYYKVLSLGGIMPKPTTSEFLPNLEIEAWISKNPVKGLAGGYTILRQKGEDYIDHGFIYNSIGIHRVAEGYQAVYIETGHALGKPFPRQEWAVKFAALASSLGIWPKDVNVITEELPVVECYKYCLRQPCDIQWILETIRQFVLPSDKKKPIHRKKHTAVRKEDLKFIDVADEEDSDYPTDFGEDETSKPQTPEENEADTVLDFGTVV